MELSRPYMDKENVVQAADLPFEFFMNRFRLVEPCPIADFEALTGVPLQSNELRALEDAEKQGLLAITDSHWQVTAKGRRYLNTLLTCFV